MPASSLPPRYRIRNLRDLQELSDRRPLLVVHREHRVNRVDELLAIMRDEDGQMNLLKSRHREVRLVIKKDALREKLVHRAAQPEHVDRARVNVLVDNLRRIVLKSPLDVLNLSFRWEEVTRPPDVKELAGALSGHENTARKHITMNDRLRHPSTEILEWLEVMELRDALEDARHDTPALLLGDELILIQTIDIVMERSKRKVLGDDRDPLQLRLVRRGDDLREEGRVDLGRECDLLNASINRLRGVILQEDLAAQVRLPSGIIGHLDEALILRLFKDTTLGVPIRVTE